MNLYNTLEQQLKKEPNFVTDNGELKKWVVLNKAQNFDEELIGLLLDNAELKEKFFRTLSLSKGESITVFNQNLFVQFLEQKNYLNDSYTQYKNKVGLTIDGKYLKQRNEVALVWPFKDCILEGGQSREEDKREEIFFNEILAQDEITQLLEPKVLTNARRIETDTSTGSVQATEKPFDQFNRNENGTITDNLIIKGNNLLALHTLKEEFAGKVKLIYIDPPYNTGNDGFKYNDNFNHSTWLTFMKNRLEVARELLREDGVIFVQCDDNEQAYLKVLMDEVFGRENFVATLVWRKKYGGGKGSRFFVDMHEYINCYAINTKNLDNFLIDRNNNQKEIFKEKDIYYEERGGYYIRPLKSGLAERKTLVYPIKCPDGSFIETQWICAEKTFKELLKEERIVFKKLNTGKYNVYKKFYEKDGGGKVLTESIIYDLAYNQQGKEEIKNLFNISEGRDVVFEYSKPEKLIQRIIEMSTDPGDIVLDYHLGSGTTAAVAHKMGRQYIGIEQMDYVETIAVERLKKVIAGEQGGISKSVNWQGGGSFVYCELKKYNQTFIEQIEKAKDLPDGKAGTEALLKIWEQMKAKSFLNYNMDIKKQDEHLEEFKALSLAEQKQHLCELLDKNQLYVNRSSLHDADFACTEEEKRLNHDFYKMK